MFFILTHLYGLINGISPVSYTHLDEDGIGIALPTTGTNHSTAYQREHGLFNTLAPYAHARLRFDFGYLPKERAQELESPINQILGE